MSTQGRINKSTTKFVPKRKAGVAPTSSSGSYGGNRASSATPSLSGATPRQLPFTSTTLSSLEAIDEFDLDAQGGGEDAGARGAGAGAAGESLGATDSGTAGLLAKSNLSTKIIAPSSRGGSNKKGLSSENVDGASKNSRGSSSSRTNQTLPPRSLPTTKGSSNTVSQDSISTIPIQATSSTSNDLTLPTFFAPRDPSIRSSKRVNSTVTPTTHSTAVQVVNPTIANPTEILPRPKSTTKMTNTTIDRNSTSLKVSSEGPTIRKKSSTTTTSSWVDSSPSTNPVSAIASTSSTVLEGVPDDFNDRGLPVTMERAAPASATTSTTTTKAPPTTTAGENFSTVAAKKAPLKRGRKSKTLTAVASPPSLPGATTTSVDLATAEAQFVPETRRNTTSGNTTHRQEIADKSSTNTLTIHNDRNKTINNESSGSSSRKKRKVPLIDIVRSPQSDVRTSKRIATGGNVEKRVEWVDEGEKVVEKSSNNMPETKRRRGSTKVTAQESRLMNESTGNRIELGEEAEEAIGEEEEEGRQKKKKKTTTKTKRPRKLAKTKKSLRKTRGDMVSESEEEDEEEVQSLLVPSVLSQGNKMKPRPVNGNDEVDGIRKGHDADNRAHYDDEEEDGEVVNEDDDHLLDSEEQETQDAALREPIGHVVDVVVTTMADLATTKDVIAGRVSKRGLELIQMAHEKKKNRKEALRKQKELIAKKDRGEAIQESESIEYPEQDISDNINGGVQSDSIREDSLPPLTTIKKRLNSQVASNIASNDVESEDLVTVDVIAGEDEVPAEEAADEYGEMATTQYAPQVRMVNGKLVVDETSLEVDRAQDERLGHVGPRVTIYEDPKDRSTTNSSTWGKQRRSERWLDEETDLFYDCLSQFGTDFEMIAGLFPARTRRQIKAKWTKEDKLNPHRITNALTRRMTIDLEKYAQITGQDLSGPVPDDPFERIQKLRSETEATDKEIGKKFGRAPTDDIAFHESFLSIAGASAPVVIEESHSNNVEVAPEEGMTRETEAEAEAQAQAEAVEAAELQLQAEVDAVLAAEEIPNAVKKRGSKSRRK